MRYKMSCSLLRITHYVNRNRNEITLSDLTANAIVGLRICTDFTFSSYSPSRTKNRK